MTLHLLEPAGKLLTGTQNINLTIFQEAEPLAKEGLGLDVSGIVH